MSAGHPWLTTGMETCRSKSLVITGWHGSGFLSGVLRVLATTTHEFVIFLIFFNLIDYYITYFGNPFLFIKIFKIHNNIHGDTMKNKIKKGGKGGAGGWSSRLLLPLLLPSFPLLPPPLPPPFTLPPAPAAHPRWWWCCQFPLLPLPFTLYCEYTNIFPFSPLLFIVSITFLISFRSYYLNLAI